MGRAILKRDYTEGEKEKEVTEKKKKAEETLDK